MEQENGEIKALQEQLRLRLKQTQEQLAAEVSCVSVEYRKDKFDWVDFERFVFWSAFFALIDFYN
jgi:hypothetical protein